MPVVNIYGNQVEYTLALRRGGLTPTGRAINRFLEDPARTFDVVVLGHGETFGQMMVEDDPASPETENARRVYKRHTGTRVIARPTVFWCPDYAFEYYGAVDGLAMSGDGTLRVKRLGELQPGDYFYKYAAGNRIIDVVVVRYTRAYMPPWIVLYHELGHVKQYYEPHALNPAADIGAAWSARLLNTDQIEADNLRDHENPMCIGASLSPRAHYKHMANGFGFVTNQFNSPSKAPALRVSEDVPHRTIDDAALLALATHPVGVAPPQTGFFRR